MNQIVKRSINPQPTHQPKTQVHFALSVRKLCCIAAMFFSSWSFPIASCLFSFSKAKIRCLAASSTSPLLKQWSGIAEPSSSGPASLARDACSTASRFSKCSLSRVRYCFSTLLWHSRSCKSLSGTGGFLRVGVLGLRDAERSLTSGRVLLLLLSPSRLLLVGD